MTEVSDTAAPPPALTRKPSWAAFIVIPAAVVLLILALTYFQIPFPATISLAVYVVIVMLPRLFILKDFRKGMKLLKQRNVEAAEPLFSKTEAYLAAHPIVNRIVAFLGFSSMTYHEMALSNLAYCEFQKGDPVATRNAYLRLQERYPESPIAHDALKMLDMSSAQHQSG